MQRKRKISAATEASVWIENKTATGLSIVLNKLFDCLVSKKILLDSLQVLMSVCGCELTVTVHIRMFQNVPECSRMLQNGL